MYNKEYALLAILLGSVATTAFALIPAYAAPSITVQTDKTAYSAGDNIKVTGKVTVDTGNVDQPILIRILDPLGGLVRTDQVTAGADGTYTYQFPSGGQLMGKDGSYKIITTYKGTTTQQAPFQFTAAEQWKTFTLNAGGKTYPIQYMITGNNTVKSMQANQNQTTLTINVSATSDGTLHLKLPRNVIDARENGTSGADTSFTVFLDDTENVEPDESTPGTADMRQISIDFPAGTEKIDVTGTFAVPEFGSIAAIMLGISIVGIIIATARYSNKLNLPRL
jgi:predicted secreted protein with PEFG-CTERM motif